MKKLLPFLCVVLTPLSAFSEAGISAKTYNEINEVFEKIKSGKFRNNKNGETSKESRSSLCTHDEIHFAGIENTLLQPFQINLKNKSMDSIRELLLPDSRISLGLLSDLHKTRSFDKIDEFSWKAPTPLTRENFIAGFQTFLGSRNIHHVDIVIDKMTVPERVKGKLEFNEAILEGYLEVMSLGDGIRRIDRGNVMLTVKKIQGNWKISQIEGPAGKTLIVNREPAFKEITAETGIQIPTYMRTEAIRRGGYSVSISDIDNNHRPDIFVGSAQESFMFRNEGGSSYSQINKELFNNITLAKSSAFADFTNSGHQDLIVARFNPYEKEKDPLSDIIYFKNNGNGTFSRKDQSFKMGKDWDGETWHSMPMAIGDFNKDSRTDVYIGFPGSEDFTTLNDSQLLNAKRIKQGVFANQAEGKFVGASADTFPSRQHAYPHSSLFVDYDLDNDMDLFVLDDRINLSPFYENKNGKFYQKNEEIDFFSYDYGMGIDFADFNMDGNLDFVLSNVNFQSAERMLHSCKANWDHDEVLKGEAGLNGLVYFEMNPKTKKLERKTRMSGLTRFGEGVGGILSLDYNEDGLMDLYVTNGLWSGSDDIEKENDISAFALSLFGSSVFEDARNRIREIENKHTLVHEILKGHSGPVFPLRRESSGNPVSLAGYQRNKLFRNNGNGTFTEVGFLENVDSLADGYVAAQADIDGDNKVDLVLRNGDPGRPGVKYPAVQVFKNNFYKNQSVLLTLKGKGNSNPDAIGSIVRAQIGGKKFVRHLASLRGTAQSQKIIHLGLDSNSKVDELEITWPSGKKEILKNLQPGHYLVEEGSGVKKINSKPAAKFAITSFFSKLFN